MNGATHGGPVYVWRYQLRPRRGREALLPARDHLGALVRTGDGIACLHPWPEFGDAPLGDQLEALAAGATTPLVEQARHCAAEDAAARRDGRSLFARKPMPECHFTGGDGAGPVPPGFRAAKFKVGGDPAAATRALEAAEGAMVRLDANAGFTRSGFERWARALEPELRARIDFVEDPYPFGLEAWCATEWATGVALAQDLEPGGGWDGVRVAKPAREHVAPSPGRRTVVTSYLDHPLGQTWAAYVATGFPGEIHGVLTHRLFERDEFVEMLGEEGPFLPQPPGTGLGFDGLLEKLPWKKL
jgi:O-succinylbenzoate synthase